MPSYLTHATLGVGVGVVIAGVSQDPLVVPVAIAASLFPDIDQPGSYASRRLIPVPGVIQGWLGRHFRGWPGVTRHRHAWHSLGAALAAGFAAALGGVLLLGVSMGWWLGLAAFGGWVSHIAADGMLGPRRRRTSRPRSLRRVPSAGARAERGRVALRRLW